MPRRRHPLFYGCLMAFGLGAGPGGCASGPETASLATFTNSDAPIVNGAPVDVYTRIASGLNACWLGPEKPLHGRYMLNAEVDPAQPGIARISIHERNKEGRHGRKAVTVDLIKYGEQTRIVVSNKRLAAASGNQLSDDIVRWGRGESACASQRGWSPDVIGTTSAN